jgi:uncharacterized membrane protein YebE (DUF533 family)
MPMLLMLMPIHANVAAAVADGHVDVVEVNAIDADAN